MRAMRAEEFSGYEGLKLVDLPKPTVSDGRVLLRMTAAGSTATTAAGPLVAKSSDGLNLSVRTDEYVGNDAILVIHSFGQSRLCWSKQTSSSLTEHYRVVSFDLRGHGNSDKPDHAAAYASGEQWADDLHAVMETACLRVLRDRSRCWTYTVPVRHHRRLRFTPILWKRGVRSAATSRSACRGFFLKHSTGSRDRSRK